LVLAEQDQVLLHQILQGAMVQIQFFQQLLQLEVAEETLLEGLVV
jgi:hypothetical protein